MKSRNKILIYVSLINFLILLATAVWAKHSYEIRERDRYAALFKERLTIFEYLEEDNYNDATKLLAILLTGDVVTFQKFGSGINAQEYDLCRLLSSDVKEKLISFHDEEKANGDDALEFSMLKSRCID